MKQQLGGERISLMGQRWEVASAASLACAQQSSVSTSQSCGMLGYFSWLCNVLALSKVL